MCVCVCEREREGEIINDAGDVAYVVVAANADVAVFAAHVAIDDVDLDDVVADVALAVDAVLAVDPIIDAAWGAAPPKAHKKRSRPRSSNHFGKNSPRRHYPSISSSSFLLNPCAI